MKKVQKTVQTVNRNGAKAGKVSTTRFPKPGELKPIAELLDIPDEQIPDDTVEDYIQMPTHTHWQWKEIRRRIIEHHEGDRVKAQLFNHLEEFRREKRKWGDVAPVSMNVTLCLGEWENVMDIANAEGWTLEEAVSQLLFKGMEAYHFAAIKERNKDEHFARQKAKN